MSIQPLLQKTPDITPLLEDCLFQCRAPPSTEMLERIELNTPLMVSYLDTAVFLSLSWLHLT